ncbi:MAG: LysM peptidoglycan-binding domain-containing protein [Cyanobacteria bacterium]|nr:LysM peptidoglycan-binding domain-containing protein [Cyanobacteriota bacterium]
MRRSLAALALALVLPLPALAGTITVKPGETLSEIADRLGISMKRLMELNGISKADHVEVGQKLKVPGPAGSSTSASGGGAVATGRLTVREGDTLSDIAVRQGMSLNQLIALNGLSRADHVEVGQTLKVTGKVATAPAPNPFRKGATMHVVRSGESLSAIAEGYGVPMSRLVAINAINDPDHVEVGTQLKLKGAPAAPRPRPVEAAAPRPTPASAPRERPVQAAAPRPEAVAAAEVPKASQPVVTQATAIASSIAPASAAAWPAASSTTASQASAPAPAVAAPVRATPVARTPIAAATAAASTPIAAITPVAAAVPTPRPSTAAASLNPRPVAPQTRTAAATATQASAPATAVATSSWRRYGPLQVDWSNWQPMGGSLVAPILNAKGDTLYLAINCGARKMNATSAAGDWRTWDDPQADFERRLVNDLCSSRG